MKFLSLPTFALTLLAASLPLTLPVQAGTALQRCQADDGTVIYTDQACAALGAEPQPLPGEVLNRLIRAAAPTASSPENSRDAAASNAIGSTVARRAAAAGCARSPTQLAMDLRGSLALRDVNRLAESYHWVGVTQDQSKPLMQRLERMTQRPLDDAHYFDAQIGPGGMQLAEAGAGHSSGGVMQLQFGGAAPQVLDLEVERYAGCYFVRF